MKEEILIQEIIIDYDKCPFCYSTDISFITKKDEYSQHQCKKCKTAWKDFVSEIERKKVEWREW